MKIKSIKPLFNRVLVTAEKYKEDSFHNGLIVNKEGTLKEYQTVVAVGTTVRDIKVGDIVLVNPSRYMVKKIDPNSVKNEFNVDNPIISYKFNVVDIEGVAHLLIYDSDIDYVVTDYEEDDTGSTLIVPDTTIYT